MKYNTKTITTCYNMYVLRFDSGRLSASALAGRRGDAVMKKNMSAKRKKVWTIMPMHCGKAGTAPFTISPIFLQYGRFLIPPCIPK
jgi:hypothetical protein